MRSKIGAFTLFLTMSFSLVASSARAAGPLAVVEPPPHGPKFFTRQRIIILSAGAAMMAADLITTQRALQVPGAHEANPLAQSAGARYGLKLAGFGAGLGISYALHKTGHYKAARLIPMIIGIPSAAAAIHNAGIH